MKKLFYLTAMSIFIFSSCLTPKSDPDTSTSSGSVGSKSDKPTYVATKKEYEETFIQVDDFVIKLNKIISQQNFNGWKKHLSDSYIEKYSSPEFLKELSENPGLKNFNIKVRTLRDYFKYVVVPSRSDVKIDEIQFVTEDRIKVYTVANNTKFVVYQLIREGSEWIITE